MLPLRKLGKVYIESLCEPPGKPCYFRVCVCVCVCVCVYVELCPTLCDPMDCSPPGSSEEYQILHYSGEYSKNTEVGCHSLLQGLFLVTACKSTVISNFH